MVNEGRGERTRGECALAGIPSVGNLQALRRGNEVLLGGGTRTAHQVVLTRPSMLAKHRSNPLIRLEKA